MSRPRVQFVHGLEGSPQGAKARLFAAQFEACTPAMDTRNFESCVRVQAETLARFAPDVLVGSSYGGAVVLALLQRGLWRGPTLLLAQAAVLMGLPAELPPGVRVWLVHGSRDSLVDPEHSRQLARAGRADEVRLIEVDDDHSLTASVESGALAGWVREMWELSRPAGRHRGA